MLPCILVNKDFHNFLYLYRSIFRTL